MIITTGIDLVETARIQQSMKSPRFLTRVFSLREQNELSARHFSPQSVAANFAAKEAFAKAIGTGVRGFQLREVELLHDPAGRPYFAFVGAAQQIVERLGFQFSVSLTHTQQYAAASVVAWQAEAQPATDHSSVT